MPADDWKVRGPTVLVRMKASEEGESGARRIAPRQEFQISPLGLQQAATRVWSGVEAQPFPLNLQARAKQGYSDVDAISGMGARGLRGQHSHRLGVVHDLDGGLHSGVG